jgi:RES domain-containing protein
LVQSRIASRSKYASTSSASFGRAAFAAPKRNSAAVITDTLNDSACFSNLSRIAVSRALGDAWLKTNNSPALRVPTVITPGEWNVLVNPLHPQFSLKWVVTGPDAYTFDARLLPVKKRIRSRRTPRDR